MGKPLILGVIVLCLFLIFSYGQRQALINQVKKACPEAYPDTSYGEVLKAITTKQKWTISKDPEGDKMVVFTGTHHNGSTIRFEFWMAGNWVMLAKLHVDGVEQDAMKMMVTVMVFFEGYKMGITK